MRGRSEGSYRPLHAFATGRYCGFGIARHDGPMNTTESLIDEARLGRILLGELGSLCGTNRLIQPCARRLLERRPDWAAAMVCDPLRFSEWLAVDLEDSVACEGQPLSDHLNARALAEWRGAVRRKVSKSIRIARGEW